VLIAKHAIERLHERLPLPDRESLFHQGMVRAFERPVLFPQGSNRYLVEFRMGKDRLGYFVAEVHPGFVLIKSFLFLTMEGTPESKLLKEKLGLHRADVEYYNLDQFFTLFGTDIGKDPLLHKGMYDCGCAHMLNVMNPKNRPSWIEAIGDRFKKTFVLQEAPNGFIVGQK
jgi:hypothetical protein